MIVKLPKNLRQDASYRKCALGVDLPASFVHDLWGLDSCLFPIFHAYRLLWDSVINNYHGSLEDPRYIINRSYGELNFGFVLTNGKGEPSQEPAWHIWELKLPYGWCHVIKIESKDKIYLNHLLRVMYLQAKWNDKYGRKGYSKHLQEIDEEAREKEMQNRRNLMLDINNENSAMFNRVKQNFEYGRTAPTNPTKDIIYSGKGINNRSRIVRSITDTEGGLILPD